MKTSLGQFPCVVVLSLACVLELSIQPGAAQLQDVDGDGYFSIPSGGNDCVDSLMSVYKANALCEENAPATILNTPGGPGEPSNAADHSWIRDAGGVYHLFSHDGYCSTCPTSTQTYIRHHVANADLTQVSLLPAPSFRALEPGTGPSKVGWDSEGLWAPHVVQHDGTYYMFYTGTTAPGKQSHHVERIGLATSQDLVHWTKVPSRCPNVVGDGCIYECTATWSRWGESCPPANHDYQCRDPFVIKVPGENRWLMFVTTSLKADGANRPASTGVAVAETADITSNVWTRLGYVDATRRILGGIGGQPTGGIAENPSVTSFNGKYYLFFTDWQDPQTPPATMVQYVTSSNLTADANGSSNWTYRGYIPEAGVNATEFIVHEGDTWIMSNAIVNQWDLRLKRVVWNDDAGLTFSYRNLTRPSCRISSASIHPGAPEVCADGWDNDCDGQQNEGCGTCRPPCEFTEP